MTNLKEQKKILKSNIKWEKDMIDNNKSYKGPDGKTYGPDHYKKAIKYDIKDLKRVSEELEKQKKIKAMKNAAKGVKSIKEQGEEKLTSNIKKKK